MALRVLLLTGTLMAVPVWAAQDAATPQEGAAPGAEVAEQGGLPGFIYLPEGRRDPFVSLIRRGAELEAAAGGRQGIAGLAVDEVALRGVLRTPEGYVALIEGADSRTYVVRAGDMLLDGTVERIAADDMVIRQRVSDPLSLESEREVRKTLRQIEETGP